MSKLIKKFKEQFEIKTKQKGDTLLQEYYNDKIILERLDGEAIEQFLQQSEQEIRNEICEKVEKKVRISNKGNKWVEFDDVIQIIKSQE